MIDLTLKKIKEIESEYGCPFYLFDEKSFIENYRLLESTLKSYYSKYHIAYSYKTNYTPYICSLVKSMGGYAEVVSEMERYIAETIGYTSDKIIYNGPNKGNGGIDAVAEGCIVNVDSIDELKDIIEFAGQHKNNKFHIGIRVNLDIAPDFVSRFGMDEIDIENAFLLVSRVPNLFVDGLHCHISRCRGLEAWRKRTQTMLEKVDQYFKDQPPKYIDLGSGMFGAMDPELSIQFDNIPTYEEYAKVTAGIVAEHYMNYPDVQKPYLFTEPGTTLVNRYIDFIGKIEKIKTVRGKSFAVLNSSEHNLGETCTLKQLPVRIWNDSENTQEYKDIDLTGYTCLEQDVMYKCYSGRISNGDYVQFNNVGGYSNVYKPPFIRPNCSMIVLTPSGNCKMIKQTETYEDLLHTYVF